MYSIYIYTCKLCVRAFVNIETQRDGERERDGILHMHSIYSKYISYLHIYICIYILNNTSKTMKSQRLQKQMGLEAFSNSTSHKAYWSGLKCSV